MERRKYKRTPMSMFVFVGHDNGEAVGEVIDASLNGIRVKTAKAIPTDAEVDIQIQLGGKSDGKSVKFGGRVVRRDPKEVGIHIETIDMDSFLVWREMVNQFLDAATNGHHTLKREAS
ncbi:MAG: PilZ domain-containing protein [Phycisphaerae bacterium]|nr:PilZ domain-containing protein [Phycisphaerae bacterium]